MEREEVKEEESRWPLRKEKSESNLVTEWRIRADSPRRRRRGGDGGEGWTTEVESLGASSVVVVGSGATDVGDAVVTERAASGAAEAGAGAASKATANASASGRKAVQMRTRRRGISRNT